MKKAVIKILCLLLILNFPLIGWANSGSKGVVSKKSCYVYISVNQEKKIVIFKLNREKGELVQEGELKLAGLPGSLCTDPKDNNMYAALRDVKGVASMKIDKKTGKLIHLGDTPVADNPVYISTDNSGKFLFFTSYSGNKSAVYPIQEGIVNSKAIQVMEAPMNPHMIKTDPSGKYIFVPNKGADQVQQFIFNKDGSLTPNTPDIIKFKPNTGPRHFTFNPSGNTVYIVDEVSCTVHAFHYNKEKGTLEGPFQEITTKPSDFTANNTCADIHITPNGKYLYASNRGHDSLAGYAVDQKTGLLTPIGWFATEKEPREFAIDPSGEFVIAAGESSGKIALYRIEANGNLALLKTYEVGKWPVWVLALDFRH
jgi:6-phosphogluconolactonase